MLIADSAGQFQQMGNEVCDHLIVLSSSQQERTYYHSELQVCSDLSGFALRLQHNQTNSNQREKLRNKKQQFYLFRANDLCRHSFGSVSMLFFPKDYTFLLLLQLKEEMNATRKKIAILIHVWLEIFTFHKKRICI